MEFQLNLEKLKIEKGQTPSKVSDSNAKYKDPKVPKFEEGQDIDSYHPLVDIPGQAYTPFCKCLISSPPAVSKFPSIGFTG
jgi:hypothetical protein